MRIAHLSDIHVLEPRPSFGFDVRFVSFGRSLDIEGRAAKLESALAAAKVRGAEHVVISGDLTETGTPEQYEVFASVLWASAWRPEDVTLVPGNHDVYEHPDAWKQALEGPLRPWRGNAADEPGKVIERDDVMILPVDCTFHQPVTRSAGTITDETATALARRLGDAAIAKKPVILVQHHPPFAHTTRLWHWIDGLCNYARLLDLLVRHANVHLLHGHLHKVVDRIVNIGHKRVFGTSAIVEDPVGRPRVRVYDIVQDVLAPARDAA